MYDNKPILNIIEDGSDKLLSGAIIPEIQLRYVKPAEGIPPFQVRNSYSAADFLRTVFPEGELQLQEHFFVLLLNRRNFVIGYYHQSKGGISGTVVDVRLVFAAAIKAGATSMILCHNHPSGNTKPSHEDITLTKKIIEGGNFLDVTVNDHIILTPDSYVSMLDEGLMGFTSSYASDGSALGEDKEEYVKEISRYLHSGLKQNKKQVEKLAASFGITDKTEVKELTELAIVRIAREFAHQEHFGTRERFNEIVGLYENQVNLSHRTSQSILLQQYSTPAPIAYLAGIFCGIDRFSPDQLAFEPSAGNGLLTIAGKPENFVVNEIDETRYRNLTTQGFKELYQTDATQDFSQSIDSTFKNRFDAVITNPPFGKMATPVAFDNYPIEALEQVMALRALDTMKDSGRAVIIIGGHTPYDDKGRVRNGRERIFFNYLYSHYYVADVIPIDGSKLYSRQGTSFDTRLILIAGRKANIQGAAPVFDADRERIAKTFDELYELVMDALATPATHSPENETVMDNENLKQYKQVKPKYSDAIILVDSGEHFETFYQDAIDVSKIIGSVLTNLEIRNEKVPFTLIPSDRIDIVMSKIVRSGRKVALMQPLKNKNRRNSLSLEEQMKALESELLNDIDKIKNGEELGAPYMPSSESCTVLNTVVPDSMDYETRQALEFIKREVGGDIDEFVRQRLKYKSKLDLCKSLSAEQTDAVAMAIYNIEAREQGMIIGDQTGIGKGRVAAAMIRYAVLQGHKPVFITEKPNLFSDIYRDLMAIGSGHFVPFIVNGRESKTDVKDENGEILHQALPAPEQKKVFESRSIPLGADFVVATYSQFNSPDKKPEKPQFLLSIAENNIFILDESHNASGSSQVGEFLQGVLAQTKGVVFLSATFAKRPDNMPIYAMKTAIRDANMTRDDLIAAIIKGGVALQEVLASQLVKEGQMLRRERSFEGVEVNYITLDELATEHMAIADNITEILREIIAFQSGHIDKMIDELDDIAVAEGKQVDMREGTSQAGVDNLPYFSKVFQVINQMLFSIKASAVADRAIERLRDGKKPVIAFASTMGSFIESMENEKGLPVGDGDTINADFSEVLMRGLEGSLRYTETMADGSKEFKKLDVSAFSAEIRAEYLRIAEKIKKMSSGISISPIDIIIKKITEAGYKVAEVTGRKYEVQINSKTNKGLVMSRNRINTNDAFRRFNNNEVDVLMINQSGSTGASAHAIVTKSVPASEVKQRVMIVLQAELDINTEVQKRGRINRTGQILSPIYDYMMSAIPAEKRLMMMLQKKLKSLDANTTSNQKQSTKILDVPDFLNKYGDKIVTQYLVDNKDINKLLGDPLKLEESDNEDGAVTEEAAHKVSGRVAVLSTKMQSDFYTEVSQAYNDYVEYLKQIGEYDLEVEAMNLEAETLGTSVARMGKGGDSEFGNDSILEKVEANVLKKPFTKTELQNILNESLSGKQAKEIQSDLFKEFEDFMDAQLEKDLAESEKHFDEEIANIPNEKKALKLREKDGEAAYLEFIKEREDQLQDAKQKQADKIKTTSSNRKQYLSSIFKFFYIGRNLEYPVSSYAEGDIRVFSVFVGFIIDRKKKNPFAPSNIRLRFALASSNKYFAVPASFTKDINAIMGASYSVSTSNIENTLERWEDEIKKSAKDRSVRYIVTGNLLQAFAQFKGKLVSYTTKSGEVKKGTLMPEYWEPSTEMEDKISVPVSRAENVILSTVRGNSIQTENGTTLINLDGKFKIIVPASRQRGGEVYLDADILKLVNENNFNKVADKMVAFIDHADMSELLRILQSKFNDSVKVTSYQFKQINENVERPVRKKIVLISKHEAEEQEKLSLLAMAVEVELELELELLKMKQAA